MYVWDSASKDKNSNGGSRPKGAESHGATISPRQNIMSMIEKLWAERRSCSTKFRFKLSLVTRLRRIRIEEFAQIPKEVDRSWHIAVQSRRSITDNFCASGLSSGVWWRYWRFPKSHTVRTALLAFHWSAVFPLIQQLGLSPLERLDFREVKLVGVNETRAGQKVGKNSSDFLMIHPTWMWADPCGRWWTRLVVDYF